MADTEAPVAEPPSTSTVATWLPPKVTHTWTAKGLSVASITGAAPGAELRGPVFEACGLRWQVSIELQFLMREHGENNQPRIAFFLNLLERTSEPVKLGHATMLIHGLHEAPMRFTNSFWLRGAGDKPLPYSLDNPKHGAKIISKRGGYQFTHADFVKKAVLQGGSLTITVTLRGRSYAELAVPVPPEPSLLADVAAALPAAGAAPPEGADVAFTASGERIWAHSFVLATRSPTLRAALWGPLSRSHAGAAGAQQFRELDLPGGVDVSTFRRVLLYMYTDANPQTARLNDAELSALLQSSDYLGIERLKILCLAEFQKRLTVENAVAVLQLAHVLSFVQLKDAALRFIASDAHAVMRSPTWGELMHDQTLLQAVLSTLATGEPPALISSALRDDVGYYAAAAVAY